MAAPQRAPQLASDGGDHGSGEDVTVPPLRQDLEILPAGPAVNGAPGFLLFDPYRNAHFRIDLAAFHLLSNWDHGKAKAVLAAARQEMGLAISETVLSGLIKFLFANHLTLTSMTGEVDAYVDNHKRTQKSLLSQSMHSYLFFKIPLFRPQRFLNATWPLVRPLFSKTCVWLLALFGAVGLYLVSRQWDSFQGQFMSLLSWNGAVVYGATLIFVKVIHELGHAYMARRYRVDVPVIGVAFLVLMPIMYTDTSSAWRLRRRQERLMIDGAGIMAELMLAVIATLLWVFLPDGALRTVAFTTATVSWLLSLFINLNPFMRFDGYYILSDALGLENLQARGFALARWRMREILFGLNEPAPEYLPVRMQRLVIFHAWATWIYRFFLFLGIALLVYHLFTKVLGIVLFVVEIFYFILLPIFRELRQWFEQRESIMQTKRSRITLLVGLALVAWAFMPVLGTVRLPAVLHAQNEQQIYPRVAGQLERFAVTAGQEVRRGDVLVRLSSDQLQLEMRLASQRHDLLQRRLIMAAQDATLKAQTRILEREIASVQRELEGLAAKERELMITADLDGTVVDLEPTLSPGQYVPSGARLFIIRGGESQALTGFVQETDVARLSTSTTGRFVPDNARLPTVPVTLSAIRRTAAIKLEHLELSETQGGSIPLQEGGDTASNIDGSYYRADFAPAAASDLRISSDQTVRGVIHLDAEARSFARIVFERVWSVLIRESGF